MALRREVRERLWEAMEVASEKKEEFECPVMRAKVLRVPLSFQGVYVERDIVGMYKDKKVFIGFCASGYSLVKNEQLLSIVSQEVKPKDLRKYVDENGYVFNFKAILTDDLSIVGRNSYMPSVALSILLLFQNVPIFSLSRRHYGKDILFGVKNNLEAVLPNIDKRVENLRNFYVEGIPDFLKEKIKKKIRVEREKSIGGVKKIKTEAIGEALLLKHQNSSLFDFVVDLTREVYTSRKFWLKKQTENLLIDLYEKLGV